MEIEFYCIFKCTSFIMVFPNDTATLLRKAFTGTLRSSLDADGLLQSLCDEVIWFMAPASGILSSSI